MSPYASSSYWNLYRKQFPKAEFVDDKVIFIKDAKGNAISLPGLCNHVESLQDIFCVIEEHNIKALYLFARNPDFWTECRQKKYQQSKFDAGYFNVSNRTLFQTDLNAVKKSYDHWRIAMRKDTRKVLDKLDNQAN